MDVLSDILDATRLRGTLYFTTELTPPWGIRVPFHRRVVRFHLVSRGRLWVRVEGEKRTDLLEPGDLVLVPHGAVHELLDSPDSAVEELDRVVEASGFRGEGSLVYGGESQGGPTRLACGHFALDPHVDHPLLDRLPARIVVRREEGGARSRMEELVHQVTDEATRGGAGSHAAVRRLSEVLLIQVLRTWAGRDGPDHGFLAALSDRQLGRSLERIHTAPAERWSLDSLARAAGLSRTAFAERFRETVGMPPIQYLTMWRIQRARRLLVESDLPLQRIAEGVGYESASALSRVFKRWVGEPPGSYRRRGRVEAESPA